VGDSNRRRVLVPWGSKAGMRTFAVLAVIGGLVLICVGLSVVLGRHHRGSGVSLIAVGVIVLIPMCLALPVARRKGKI
jgi:hypothetical protein